MKTTGSLQLVFTMPRVWDLSMAGNTSQRDFLFENVRSAEVRKEMRQFCMDSVIHHMIQARDGEAKQKKKGHETCGDTVAKCGTEQEVFIFSIAMILVCLRQNASTFVLYCTSFASWISLHSKNHVNLSPCTYLCQPVVKTGNNLG